MKNSEFQKWLKQFPADAEVKIVTNWEEVDENGIITGTVNVEEGFNINYQNVVVDLGLDFEDVTEILIG